MLVIVTVASENETVMKKWFSIIYIKLGYIKNMAIAGNIKCLCMLIIYI